MKTFIIQNLDYDFCWHLKKAIDYQNWLYGEKQYDYVVLNGLDVDDISISYNAEIIPIGSLEFIFDYIEEYHYISRSGIKPINIPKDLIIDKFLKRYCFYIDNKSGIDSSYCWFIKSATKYKKYADIINCLNINQVPEDKYLVSEVVDIESEWRCFIFNGKLVGMSNYIGDFTLFPDVQLIKEMISQYKNCPKAYTLDVGINDLGTFVIEVHPFVSCGLYNFSNYSILPQMFISGFNEFIINH